MAVKDQVTPEQWKKLFNAISAASTFVSMASGGGLEMIKEVITAGKFAQVLYEKTGGSGYGELVDELLASMKGMTMKDAKENAIKLESRDPAGIRAELKNIVADAVTVASALPGGDGYKRWLLDMAREVTETKTGGFMGIGGKSVIDEKEHETLP